VLFHVYICVSCVSCASHILHTDHKKFSELFDYPEELDELENTREALTASDEREKLLNEVKTFYCCCCVIGPLHCVPVGAPARKEDQRGCLF
jgi:hypothetical protein